MNLAGGELLGSGDSEENAIVNPFGIVAIDVDSEAAFVAGSGVGPAFANDGVAERFSRQGGAFLSDSIAVIVAGEIKDNTTVLNRREAFEAIAVRDVAG